MWICAAKTPALLRLRLRLLQRLLLLLLPLLLLAATQLVQARQGVDAATAALQAGVPLDGEWIDIGRTVRYHLQGLDPGSHFEVRVSYPAVVRPRVLARIAWSRQDSSRLASCQDKREHGWRADPGSLDPAAGCSRQGWGNLCSPSCVGDSFVRASLSLC